MHTFRVENYFSLPKKEEKLQLKKNGWQLKRKSKNKDINNEY